MFFKRILEWETNISDKIKGSMKLRLLMSFLFLCYIAYFSFTLSSAYNISKMIIDTSEDITTTFEILNVVKDSKDYSAYKLGLSIMENNNKSDDIKYLIDDLIALERDKPLDTDNGKLTEDSMLRIMDCVEEFTESIKDKPKELEIDLKSLLFHGVLSSIFGFIMFKFCFLWLDFRLTLIVVLQTVGSLMLGANITMVGFNKSGDIVNFSSLITIITLDLFSSFLLLVGNELYIYLEPKFLKYKDKFNMVSCEEKDGNN